MSKEQWIKDQEQYIEEAREMMIGLGLTEDEADKYIEEYYY